ncbi:MAG: glycosyltransferase 87 family protein [Actinomycetota bacterium]|nr:glycosyltransferase 87 family protein [Actinomycetota bacterium]
MSPDRVRSLRGSSVAPVLVGTLTMGVGLLLRLPVLDYHGAATQPAFNAFVFRHPGAYSDVASLYFRDHLWHHPLPYLDYRFEYPVLMGAFVALASLVHTSVGAYLLVSALPLVGCGVAILWLLARFPGANPWLLALSPALALYVVLNWDLLALAATVGAVVLYARGRDLPATGLLALGVWLKLFPLLLLPLVLARRLVERRFRDAAAMVGVFALITVAVNLPLALAARHGLTWFLRFNRERPPEGLWSVLPHVHLATPTVNWLSAALTALGIAVLMVAVARARRESVLVTAFLAAVAWFFLVGKVYSPQYALWVVALLALAGAPVGVWAVFAAVDVLFFAASFTSLYLQVHERSESADFTDHFLKPAVGLRELALLVVLGWSLTRLAEGWPRLRR